MDYINTNTIEFFRLLLLIFFVFEQQVRNEESFLLIYFLNTFYHYHLWTSVLTNNIFLSISLISKPNELKFSDDMFI